MPTRVSPSDNKMYDKLTELKRHLGMCAACRAAISAHEPGLMCKGGAMMVLDAMTHFDAILKVRIKVKASGRQTVYPCPSTRAHGKTYEITAMPVYVTGVQDRLL